MKVKLIYFIIVLGLFLRLIIVVYNPTFNAPDEQSHYNYVNYLFHNHSFPIRKGLINASERDWQYASPPVYYLLLLPIYSTVYSFKGNDISLIVVFLRLVSVILWLINVFFTIKIMDNLKIKDNLIRTFTIVMIALLPTLVFLSSSVNNDNLLITFGGCILYLLTKKFEVKVTLLLGFILGIALVTKQQTIIYYVSIGIILLIRWLKGIISLKFLISRCLIILSISSPLYILWSLRNMIVYGNISGWGEASKFSIGTFNTFFLIDYANHALFFIRATFWAAAGITNNFWYNSLLGYWLFIFSLFGFIYCLLYKRQKLLRVLIEGNYYIVSMLISSILLFCMTVIYGIVYSTEGGFTGQGRYLFPMIIPTSLLMAIGISCIPFVKKFKYNYFLIAIIFSIYAIGFTYSSLNYFLRPDYANAFIEFYYK